LLSYTAALQFYVVFFPQIYTGPIARLEAFHMMDSILVGLVLDMPILASRMTAFQWVFFGQRIHIDQPLSWQEDKLEVRSA
jgi:hypothetical protein